MVYREVCVEEYEEYLMQVVATKMYGCLQDFVTKKNLVYHTDLVM